MTHITPELWQQALAGQLNTSAMQEVATHLEAGCEICESLLAEQLDVDPLDGEVDATLLQLSSRAAQGGPADELGWQRLRRQLKPQRPSRRTWLGLGATALAAAAALLLTLSPSKDVSYRLKGSDSTAPTIELQVLQVVGDQPQMLVPGSRIDKDSLLVFRLRLSEPTCLRMRVSGASTETLIGTPLCLPSGAQVLTRDGQTLAYHAYVEGDLRFTLYDTGSDHAAVEARFDLRVGNKVPGALP